jgi:IclR family KDG regulon transcriptional repressor
VIARVRERGYGEDNGEYTEGVYCIALPLKRSREHGLGALSVSIPEVRKSPELTEKTIECLRDAVTKISQRFT